MKTKPLLASLFAFALALAPALAAAEKDATSAPGATKSADAPKKYPLRGVITAVVPDKSAIMVKHEDIPGVMRAMTMMFMVDAATLKTVKTGQAITAMLSREADAWWLHDVKVVAEKKP
jgi:Cu/Ag efflux protein CusF